MFRPLLILFCLMALPARAELLVCNETDAKASFALGYKTDGAWTSEGWWIVSPYDCSVVEGSDLSNRYYYYRVTSKSYTWPGESYYFCTSPDVFTIAGDKDCADRGYDRSEFRQIDTGDATNFTLNLTAGTPLPPPPPEPLPEPGTHGEPYSINGILSHCDVFDVTMMCEIHNDGWRYIANSAGPTSQALLEEMMALPFNTPITIVGDMIGYEGLTVDVTVRSYSAGGYDPFAAERAGVQGFWRSLDDPAYQVLIYGGIMEEIYDGDYGDLSLITWAATCDGAYEAGPVMILKAFDDPEFERCMILHGVGRRLELFPVGSMDDLIFERVN